MHRYFWSIFLIVTVSLGAGVFAGCGKDSSSNGDDDKSDNVNNGEDNGGTDTNLNGNNGGTSTDDNGATSSEDVCAANDFTVTPVPVAMMILQDMSGSMDPHYDDVHNNWNNLDNPGRWSIARPAITSLLSDYADYSSGNIEFGFDIFPNSTGGNCSIGSPVIMDTLPGHSQSEEIRALLESEYPDDAPNGATPLRGAMDLFLDPSYAPNFLSPDRQSYLMIVSDGRDTCREDGRYSWDNGATAEDLGAKTEELLEAGVKTFVIGFGGGVDPDQLNAIADAGGTPFTTFLPADDKDSLEDAFSQIASSIVSCDFEVPQQGDDVDKDDVNFYINAEVVPFDENCENETGWTWTNSDFTEVRLCTAACESMQQDNAELTATWGCPTVVIIIK